MQAKPWLPLNVYLKAGAVMFPAKGQMADILGLVWGFLRVENREFFR